MRIVFVGLFIVISIVGSAVSCKPRETSSGVSSTLQTEIDTQAINWSTVTDEEAWQLIAREYDSLGPRSALSLLESAMTKGVISSTEGEQVRAGFLYDLGLIDEAFLALSVYKLDASHPDLLRLRGDVLWNMGRYHEAERDFETALTAAESTIQPEFLYSMARLYDDIGEWDKEREIRDRYAGLFPGDPGIIRLKLQDALLTENVEPISRVQQQWATASGIESLNTDPVSVAALVQIKSLEGKSDEGAGLARDFISNRDFDSNVAMTLLKLDIETGEFDVFQSDLRTCFEKSGAIAWLDAPEDIWPMPVDDPLSVARLLDWAVTFELGNGNLTRARTLIERAKSLDPYDYAAIQQLALVQLIENDIPGAVQSLNEALRIATPTDVRIRLRLLQLAPIFQGATLPWDNEEISGQLKSILDHRIQQAPDNATFRLALAEPSAWKGDLQTASRTAGQAVALPGANRDIRLRLAYYLARLGRMDDAWSIVQQNLQPGYPYLAWVKFLTIESNSRQDTNLAEFAARCRDLLDPTGEHAALFDQTGVSREQTSGMPGN
jgi:tetratricopeptide (TPR) repeat protein